LGKLFLAQKQLSLENEGLFISGFYVQGFIYPLEGLGGLAGLGGSYGLEVIFIGLA
jgi:hypothetical protein